MADLLSGFQKIDNLIDTFTLDFEKAISNVFSSHYPDMEITNDILDEIEEYATTIFHYTHSVIKKDKEYSEFRLQEELDSMNNCIDRLKNENELNAFYEEAHKKAKELLVKYYDEIYNLSANGFIILERYALFALYGFNAGFYLFIEEK